MAIKRRKQKNTPLGGPGGLVKTRVVTAKSMPLFEMSEYYKTLPLVVNDHYLYKLSDEPRRRRRPICRRKQICRRHDPMASCLVWTHFCYFIQHPGVYSQGKVKKCSPNFLPTLLWQQTTQQLFTMTEKQQKITCVNHYSAPTVAHQGAFFSASAT